MRSARKLHLGISIHGSGATKYSWRQPGIEPNASINLKHYISMAQQAEAAKFDFIFIGDSPYVTADSAPHYLNRFEPLTILSALATVTSHIGLVGTATSSYTEPFTLARQFASLDLLSGGRAGWNVVSTGIEGAAQNYGREKHFDMPSATGARPNISRWCRGCGIPGKTMPSFTTKHPVNSSTRPNSTR
jgi:alkanesulfonate monooxygenase SsuD/methylene tetrahydromethanopterin reductase-like flavin-dependent oxidoreductase (luciferase family)